MASWIGWVCQKPFRKASVCTLSNRPLRDEMAEAMRPIKPRQDRRTSPREISLTDDACANPFGLRMGIGRKGTGLAWPAHDQPTHPLRQPGRLSRVNRARRRWSSVRGCGRSPEQKQNSGPRVAKG